MRIHVLGAGPAGLSFAYLMKRSFPGHEILVSEQNGPASTFGFGVVLSERALRFLADIDRALHDRIVRHMERWSDQHICLNGERVVIEGSAFGAIERLHLLRVLQHACREVGVRLRFDRRIEDSKVAEECDLLVGADGANSFVRSLFAQAFGERITDLSNYYAWYGVETAYPAHTLTFLPAADGAFCGHHYRYRPDKSTFVAEADSRAWASTGMFAMTDEERRELMEVMFAETLAGKPLLSNRSCWRRWRLVSTDRWHFRNVVLIGDALRTAHPSIGSGTRLAFEDAVALWKALSVSSRDLQAALAGFEAARAPVRSRLDDAARKSIDWYEAMSVKMSLGAVDLAFDYATRTGVMTADRLALESPRFVSLWKERRSTGVRTQAGSS